MGWESEGNFPYVVTAGKGVVYLMAPPEKRALKSQ